MMAEYINKEKLLKKAVTIPGYSEKILAEFDVEHAPAEDVVPVVRCLECKYSDLPSGLTQKYGRPGTLTCKNRYSSCNHRNVNGTGSWKSSENQDFRMNEIKQTEYINLKEVLEMAGQQGQVTLDDLLCCDTINITTCGHCQKCLIDHSPAGRHLCMRRRFPERVSLTDFCSLCACSPTTT